ncbi:MAG TPA: tyrosine-type recombinase/integrase [Armatimonadota bacterium]|jgi:integrase/recombinase XerC
MQKREPQCAIPQTDLDVRSLERSVEGWLLDGDIRQLSDRSLGNRRMVVDKLVWFLKDRAYERCGAAEIRQFLAYLNHGHEDEGGRWGNPQCDKPVGPSTVQTYYVHVRTFFRWLVDEGLLTVSPVEGIRVPISRPDQIQPFSEAQIKALLAAARRSNHPRRDEAIVALLVDTGIRASELCGLTLEMVDLQNGHLTVHGKGGKSRPIYFGLATKRALYQYLREDPRDEADAVFLGDRGTNSGEGLTRSGLQKLIARLGRVAGIQATRCSPHTFRHTAAVFFLRNGGNGFALQKMLGHTTLKMTNHYVALADADVERQHRQYSPMDGIKKNISKSR